MTNQGRWSSTSSLATVLSTELNGLAANTNVTSTSAYDNTTNLDMYADFEIFLASGFSAVLDSCCFVRIGEAVDGVNFASPTGSPAMGLFSAATGSEGAPTSYRTTVRNVQIPPALFKIIFSHNLPGGLNATGNTVKMLPYGWDTRA